MKFQLVILLATANFAFAQAPAIAWQELIGGSGYDLFRNVVLTSDNGYFLGGRSSSNISGDKTENAYNGSDYGVLKLDSNRNIEWQRTIGGVTVNIDLEQDWLTVVMQTQDGGYMLGGYSGSPASGNKTAINKGLDDYWIVKLDAVGEIEWQKTYGGTGNEMLYSMQQTTDGGYILGGTSASMISGDKTEVSRGGFDYWVIKTDAVGNIVWQRTIGGNDFDWLNSLKQTPDGGFILGGRSASVISGDKTEGTYGSNDLWVIKLDAGGNIIWQKTIGGSGSDDLATIITTSDGGYLLGSNSGSGQSGMKTDVSRGGSDMWILKLDAFGAIVWQKTIGGSNSDSLGAYSIAGCSNGGYIIAGGSSSDISGEKTENSKGVGDAWVIRIDGAGNILWQSTIGGSAADGDNNVIQNPDGSFILGGVSGSSNSGDIDQTSNGLDDYWLLKLNPEQLSVPSQSFTRIAIHPNPNNGTFNVQFSANLGSEVQINIHDIRGREVFAKSYSKNGLFNENLQLHNVRAGMYLVTVQNGSQKEVRKIIIE